MIGDVREQLRALPAESVHCIVTSPPYWGLRDYGVDGQIGLEATPAEFIEVMVDVFNEARRVLRADGTCWINMGDSYATGAGAVGRAPGGGDQGERFIRRGMVNTQPNRKKLEGFKPKDLCMMPHRLAIALQDAGWWVRQDIVWSKPNPMPESVRDRCTKSHEYIFLLSKSASYFYDAEAVKEPAVGFADHPRNSFGTKDYAVPGQKPQKRSARGNGVGFGHGSDADGRERGRVLKGSAKSFRGGGVYTAGVAFDNDADVDRTTHGNAPNETGLRNRRSVWTMATHSFAEAHFATFPPELPEICIRAGCPPGGTVLDPFFGAGTTGLVADRLQRDCIGIELNPAYAGIARERIQGESSLLADVQVVVGTPAPRVGEARLSLIPEVDPRQITIFEMEAV
ncbi:DNA-methyltransferase [Janthinobacterium lividum]|uniref:DNA-methyltransferase n=1 Tax=Janthinobacterium lividum TaxID=29581 RepID=UPI0008D9D17D|nr:site-specific DNA-methyltransferase [Janthinobacterium lividum]